MSGLEMKYFVLKPRSKEKDDSYAMASRKAMRAYANSIWIHNEELAKDLRNWADHESGLEEI